jgi:hypothetical protein
MEGLNSSNSSSFPGPAATSAAAAGPVAGGAAAGPTAAAAAPPPPPLTLGFAQCGVEAAVAQRVGAEHRRQGTCCEDVAFWEAPMPGRPQVRREGYRLGKGAHCAAGS